MPMVCKAKHLDEKAHINELQYNRLSIGYIEFNGLVSSSDFSALERGFDCQCCKAVQIAG